MANHQVPSSKDYSSLLDFNFDLLNNRPAFDAKLLLDEHHDWYLIEYLNEMELMGISNEQTLNALLTMIGGLSNDSFCRNLSTGAPVWLNIVTHVIGTTGSNKSYLANEIIHALKTLDDKYPTTYSNRHVSNDIDNIEEPSKKKQKMEPWSFLASSITEAALSKATNHTDVMIVNPDGDNALKLLSYYEQNNIGTAQGVSSFCTSYDGIEPGSSRVTGVESSRNDRQRPSKLSMYVVSTGTKLSGSLMKIVDDGANDGVYGRVWYTHTNTVRELPDILKQKQTSLPNFTHIALCCHHFFQNRAIEFRYGLFRSDITDQSKGRISDRMKAARRQQNVNLPEFYGFTMDEHDIIQQQPPVNNTTDASLEHFSPFELANHYTNDIWNESSTLEKHIGQMWRKIPYHLPKAVATIKILRLFFRLLGNNLLYFLNSQEGNRSYPSKIIPDTFHQQLTKVFNEYFEKYSRTIVVDTKKINVLLFTADDVQAGYKWCQWKLKTTSTLFSIAQIKSIINTRLGQLSKSNSSSTKSVAQQRLDEAMKKLLKTPTIFFTNGYLSSNTLKGGSGLFMQKRNTDIKYQLVLESLLDKSFVVKCDVIRGTRTPQQLNLSPSYYKQQPCYFEESEERMKELENIGLNFSEYKQIYENSSLPKNTYFNNDGIELIKNNVWIPFYHTFLNDLMAKLMIQQRVELNEIIEFNGRFGLNNLNTNSIVSEDASDEEPVEQGFHTNDMNINLTSNQSNPRDAPSPNISSVSETHVLPNVYEVRQNYQNMESHCAAENANLFDNDTDLPQPCHSTPVDNNNELSFSTLLPAIQLTSPSSRSNPEENTILSSIVENDPLPPPINQYRSRQSMSTTLSSSTESFSSSSANKVVEVLNTSSIKFSSTNRDLLDVVDHYYGHNNEDPRTTEIIVNDTIQALISVISITDDNVVDDQPAKPATIKKRGRPRLSKSNTRVSITETEIEKVIENDNHPIWKKLILNKHVLATMSDLSRTVTGSDEINAARPKCIEKLLNIGCFLNGDEYLSGKEKAILKNSPEDPGLISALDKYGIDMDDYKESFNNHHPFGYNNHIPIPAILDINTNKNKFTPIFVDKLQADPFFSVYLRVDPEHIVKSSSPKRQTTSSNEIDLFRAQKRQKRV